MRHPIYVKSNGKIEKDHPIFSFSRSFVAPLRRNVDYQGIARRALVVEQLPDVNDCTNTSSQGFKHNLLVVNSRGRIVKNRRGFVSIPRFEVMQFPLIKLSDIKTRKFKIIE